MRVASSGRIVKTRKGKTGTLHQKNHRWESFTAKISKLNSVDPLRRVRRHDLDGESSSTASDFSYFKTGLEKWQELNLSEAFVAFTYEVLPLCDSLAQVLYFEEKIMELIITYMEKRERESLEPLLELTTDFAHDLGVRFEKHYAKTLNLVASIAGTPNDAAVIEWSFTCLAFLFKYLSKLLVPDLRPTFDTLAPLLGKSRQPPHIARFAAEAMSFLIKKAGAPTHREISLPLIVKHVLMDLQSMAGSREYGLYYHAIMTMFAESMKGNGQTVHTSGPAIFESLVVTFGEEESDASNSSLWADVVCGVLTSIIHHSRTATFKDIFNVVVQHVNVSTERFTGSANLVSFRGLMLSARMVGIVAGVRKGDRVEDWPPLLKAMSSVLKATISKSRIIDGFDQDKDLLRMLSLSVSILIQYSPMDSLIPFISPFMESSTKDPMAQHFFEFCSYLSKADSDRFRSVALPYFQKFVVAHWSEDNGDSLCVLLPTMVSSGVLPSNYGKEGFHLPQSWQDQIVSKFERLEVSPFPEQASPALHDRSPKTWHDRCLPKYNALLEVLECTSVHPSTNARIAEILLRKLKLALRPSSSLAPEEANFIVGRGFSALSRMIKGTGQVDKALKPLLLAAAPRYARLPNFLEALLEYEKSLKSSPQPESVVTKLTDAGMEEDLLVTSLISNLSTASHELRLLSLRLLEHMHNNESGTASEALSIMIMVEQTPFDLQTARSASMHIRKLATLYPTQLPDSWLKQAIPAFCFGMLTVKFAQVWEDATASLKLITESKVGEEAVAKLSFEWLHTPSMVWEGAPKVEETSRNNGLTDFECSNMMKLEQIAVESQSKVASCRDTMLQNFADAQELVPAHPPMARTQALRILASAPSIAERRSRLYVPMFLSWASKTGDEVDDDGNEKLALSDWTRKDQKSQLSIFGLFTNSVSLYKSSEVHDSILQLLTNGDIEIQRSALKAIMTWKDANIKPYEENLLNLLDEARFKDEITVLLQGDTLVQPEHRSALKPVLLRLLYGRAISRKGAASGRQGMEARRLTVLRNLSVDDISAYLEIALGELKGVKVVENGIADDKLLSTEILSTRKQLGVIHMLEGVLRELGTKCAPFASTLVDAILYCTIYSSRHLQNDVEEIDETSDEPSRVSLLKVVRQSGLKCLIMLFANATDFDYSQYLSIIDKEIVSPRLDKLPIETAQGISGVLRLLFTWSSSPRTVLILGRNQSVLPKVADCILPEKSKDEVKLFALDIIKNIVRIAGMDDEEHAQVAEDVKTQLLAPFMDHFLIQIGDVLHGNHNISKDVLESCVNTVSNLSAFITTSTQARNLVDVSVFLLDQPLRRVNPKTKGELLKILETFVPLYELQNDPSLKNKVYKTVTSLFGFFTDVPSRQVLSRVLTVFAEKDPGLQEVASICMDLNAFDTARLDTPDFDRRLRGFKAINLTRDIPFTPHQWTPLLFNMLYYIKDTEDLGILSSNSSDGICSFINVAGNSKLDSERAAFEDMLLSILLPAIYSGARAQSEVVRREYAKVMAHLVRTFPTWSEVSDMHGLLAGDDELESSFFNNILTVGKGRQSSALGQVAAAAEEGKLRAKNVSHFFIPLTEHFVLDRAEGNDAHNLAAEATATIGVLAGSLEWPQYRALLRRYIGYVRGKPGIEKQIIRLVGRVIDALAAAVEASSMEENEIDGVDAVAKKRNTLSITMPKELKLADDLTNNVLPPLTAYLHDKDESTVSLRTPIAIIIVRLLKLLPEAQLNERLPAVLTDICHILRSKAQESRDMTRDTLVKICVLLGPSCFGFILKELRGALARGYQLHVLSYTLHSMLVATTPEYAPGDLDYCLPTIVAIIMDDIFGATGQEKDAEEYVSKMKEVKSSKSHDSMELIAKTATLARLTDLVRPIQVLLKEKLNLRMVRKIDELLNRISNGLLRNSAAESRDSLTFCYEVIQDVYNSGKREVKSKQDYRLKRYLIQKGAKKGGERGSTTVYTYKLTRFAFDVMRAVLKKHDNLRTASNTAAFLPILGDAVLEAEEEVKMAAFRLLATLIKIYRVEEDGSILRITNDQRVVKVPQETAKAWTDLYRVATKEATQCISASSTTTSDISQASLKLLSVVLRDRPDVPVKPTSVDELLIRVKDDLTEPEHRHVTFKFLRSVLDAKVQTAVVYDTLDYVGTVMVTNDDNDTRDLARGAYFQFLGKYPQQKNRWKKQLGFIVANLKYDREGGRSSILDVIHLLLTKSSEEYVQEVAATCFVPLIFTLANDDSEKCRREAGEVLKEVFKRADAKRLSTFLTLLRSWVKQSDNSPVVRLALQTYGFYYESHKEDDSDVSLIQESTLSVLQSAEDPESDWEQIYAALQLIVVLVKVFPGTIFSSASKNLWKAVRNCLSYPHAWVKLSAALLTSRLFADFAEVMRNGEIESQNLPLQGSEGLRLSADDITDLTRRSANMLKTPNLTAQLANEVVKNLTFLGSLAGKHDLKWRGKLAEDEEEDDAEQDVETEKKTVLHYLFSRLSYILRRETTPPRAAALVPKSTSLQLLEHLVGQLSTATLGTSLQIILLPLHNLTDPAIPTPYSTDEDFRTGYEALKSKSDEIMESLKRKVGTEAYTEALLRVREGVKARRMQRSGKRKVEAVSMPGRYGEGKRKKVERKKERRKEKGKEYAAKRMEM